MYNTNLIINYYDIDGDEGDTHYRKQILEFLQLDMYDETVSVKISELFEKYKENDHIKKIIPYMKIYLEQRWPFEMDETTIFLFLFSFDYFYLIYPIICNLINEIKIDNKLVDNVINKIKSNFKTKK